MRVSTRPIGGFAGPFLNCLEKAFRARELFWLFVGCFGACASQGLFCLQKVEVGRAVWGKRWVTVGSFVFVRGGVRLCGCCLGFFGFGWFVFRRPEEGPGDCPEDEDDGEEEKDE